MKNMTVLILVLCVAITGYAQKVVRKGVKPIQVYKKDQVPKYTVGQLSGKWQEVLRTPVNNKAAIEFTDTLLMNFNKDKVELKDAISMRMSMTGKAQLEAPATLIAAGDIYTIRSLDKNYLVIDDGEFVKKLQKKEHFNYEAMGRLRVDKDSFKAPVLIDINNIKGRWMVYAKRAEPGTVKENVQLIRSIDIAHVIDGANATGTVYYYTTYNAESTPCKFIIKDGSIEIIAATNYWSLHTYKADGNEFVFGDIAGLLYYSKHL
ncbi:MAG: hypothetical protein ABIO04_12450 [Ferruginibacter sp.]